MAKAVIFDLDGTLLDTERDQGFWWHVFDRVFRPYGVLDVHGTAYNGRRILDNIRVIRERSGITDAVEVIHARMQEIITDLIPQYVRCFPGVHEVLEQVRRCGYRLALTTSSTRPYVDATFRHVGLAGVFDTIVTGEMVEHGKPDPAIYRRTLVELDLPADACIVVEDAMSGFQAAHAAGIPVIAVPTEPDMPRIDFKGAVAIVPRLADILQIIPCPADGTH